MLQIGTSFRGHIMSGPALALGPAVTGYEVFAVRVLGSLLPSVGVRKVPPSELSTLPDEVARVAADSLCSQVMRGCL